MEKGNQSNEREINNTLKAQITFEYYKQQREEFISLRDQRASLSLQFLIILGALVAAFFQTNVEMLKLIISALIVILGIIGLFLLYNMEISMNSYVARARAARKSLHFLEKFASSAKNFGNPSLVYGAIYLIVIIVGIIFALTVLLK